MIAGEETGTRLVVCHTCSGASYACRTLDRQWASVEPAASSRPMSVAASSATSIDERPVAVDYGVRETGVVTVEAEYAELERALARATGNVVSVHVHQNH